MAGAASTDAVAESAPRYTHKPLTPGNSTSWAIIDRENEIRVARVAGTQASVEQMVKRMNRNHARAA